MARAGLRFASLVMAWRFSLTARRFAAMASRSARWRERRVSVRWSVILSRRVTAGRSSVAVSMLPAALASESSPFARR